MTGGAIQNNTGHRGAAVNIYSDDRDKRAIFTLEDDGLITRNTGISANGNEAGGAVFVEDNAAFHMIGGTVSANKASKGGGICRLCTSERHSRIWNRVPYGWRCYFRKQSRDRRRNLQFF